ncbi:hypothetical protein O6P37_26660 [Mycobacterium sp. CPCC 205372]|uniref:Uncharacterized protein n=1 Tax=Mycobacterium hippophais TaxID=3016340 RepID=A0ABT4Q129_9MYCO|nr:hypothetical protein [Mycobacterium hippophais]MCZ8382456.1 hypothetical protein [Mycobacterium hippophais]
MSIGGTAATVIGNTVSAVAGGYGGLFDADAPVHQAQLSFDDDAKLPGGTELLRPGLRADALVRIAPQSDDEAIRTICIKLPDVYGPGRDQDFLLASSMDGVPFHHATVPAARPGDRLYSSLWLYLAGLSPVLFGARMDGEAPGQLTFLMCGVLSRFRRVGTLTVNSGATADDADAGFVARNSGGGIRPLPPVLAYRG